MHRWVQALLCLLVLAGSGGAAKWMIDHRESAAPVASEPDAPLVRVKLATPSPHRVEVRSQGTVRPRTTSQLVPEVAGRVVEVSASWAAGGFFEKDEILFAIDATNYELAAIAADEQVARAEVQLAREKEEAEIAIADWKQLRGDEPAPPLVKREPQLKQAESALEAARAAQRKAKLDLERTRVRAPYRGRIIETSIDLGQYVSPGAPVARLYSTDFVEVRLPLLDEDFAWLDLPLARRDEELEGPRVTLAARFLGRDAEWPARIVRTEGEIDARSRMVHVVARVERPFETSPEGMPPLTPGLFVRASIEGRELEEVVRVPRHALRGEERVLIVDSESRLRYRDVEVVIKEGSELLLRPPSSASVAGSPLAFGERILISPLSIVVEGMRVEIFDGSPEKEDPVDEEGETRTSGTSEAASATPPMSTPGGGTGQSATAPTSGGSEL